ncbi:sigma E protease regulator RseP [Alteromonadaceae bacterium M269]|nr:sigma E protease regulator RseP [Alteromonadaceae bacterium M269]
MLGFLWTAISFVIALSILVAVHEWGHFWVARRCGVKVLRFSIGFGKPLWSRTDKLGTEYVIAAIPLGGYVRMLDERVDEVSLEERAVAFDNQSVWKRIAIIAAGPITNFIFAIFALMLMYLLGVESVKPEIGSVTAQSIAQEANLKPGMQIKSVGGRETPDWQAINLELVSHIGGDNLQMTVTLPDSQAELERQLDIREWKFDPDKESALTSLGIIPFRPKPTTELGLVAEDSPAFAANLRKNDKIVAFDGTKMDNWEQIVSYVSARPNQETEVLVNRGGQGITVLLTIGERTIEGQVSGYMGVVPLAEPWPEGKIFLRQYGPIQALLSGVDETWRLMTLSLQMIGKLFTGDVSVKNLSGPISIAQGAGASASYGLVTFLSFLALISVNLGIINLLPLPVLDGGHLLYYFIELVSGKPVSESVQEIGFKIGSALLLILMSVAIFNDIVRL